MFQPGCNSVVIVPASGAAGVSADAGAGVDAIPAPSTSAMSKEMTAEWKRRRRMLAPAAWRAAAAHASLTVQRTASASRPRARPR